MYTWTILHSYNSLDTSPVARCTFWRRGSSSAGGTGSGAAGPAGAAGARCGMAQRRACRMCHPCTELHLLSEGACVDSHALEQTRDSSAGMHAVAAARAGGGRRGAVAPPCCQAPCRALHALPLRPTRHSLPHIAFVALWARVTKPRGGQRRQGLQAAGRQVAAGGAASCALPARCRRPRTAP